METILRLLFTFFDFAANHILLMAISTFGVEAVLVVLWITGLISGRWPAIAGALVVALLAALALCLILFVQAMRGMH